MEALAGILGGVGAVLPIIGAVVGQILSSGDRERADQYLRQMAEQFNMPLPQLQQLVAEQQQETAFNQVRPDAQANAAQRDALTQLQRVGREGSDNIEFRAASDAATRDANQADAARRGAILREMQARGQGGGGQEWALRAASAQDASNRQAAQGFQGAMEGRRQALQAMRSAGGLAGEMRGQQFQEQSARATAADTISRFNAANRQQASLYNAGLPQQNFENEMRRGGARAGVYGQAADAYNQRAANTAGTWAGIGSGAGTAASSFGQGAANDQQYQEWLRQQAGGRP